MSPTKEQINGRRSHSSSRSPRFQSAIDAMSRRKTLLQAQQSTLSARSLGSSSPATATGSNDSPAAAVAARPLATTTTTPLRRTLGATDLVLYGVGSSVGAGIYVLVGLGAEIAGPAITVSFAACGMACILTSLAYAEFASRIPVAGSAFTYAYVAFGEVWAWLVGWNLILGYGFTTGVVSRAWADYTGDFLINMAHASMGTTTASQSLLVLWLQRLTEWYPWDQDVSDYSFSILSMVIVWANCLILLRGVQESAQFNNIMTVCNISVLILVVGAGLASDSVRTDNLTPFFPEHNAASAVLQGAGLVFFAFIGFDMVASLSEEVIEPERNMPIGIVGSLLASTILYVCVSFVVVGMIPLNFLQNSSVPIVNSLLANACCTHDQQLEAHATHTCLAACHDDYVRPALALVSRMVSCGAMFGLMASAFTSFMGQPRIFYKMAQDGLWFQTFADVDPVSQVPRMGIILTGIATALLACFVPLDALANMISLGTLMVFTFVNAGVILLRLQSIAEAATKVVDTASLVESGATEETCLLSKATKRESNQQQHPHYGSIVSLLALYTIAVLSASILMANPPSKKDSSTHHHHKLSFISSEMSIGALLLIAAAAAAAIARLPESWSTSSEKPQQTTTTTTTNTFLCPWVPGIPLVGIFCNCFMMGSLPLSSWLWIALWMAFGMAVYFLYGIHNSSLGKLLLAQDGELADLLHPNVVGVGTTS